MDQNNIPVSEELILQLAKEIEEDEKKVSVLSPSRFREMSRALDLLRCIRPSEGTRVTYQLHAPMKSMGCITITGKQIEVDDPAAFQEAVRLASNTDFYPLADGGVCIDLTFHGITKHLQ